MELDPETGEQKLIEEVTTMGEKEQKVEQTKETMETDLEDKLNQNEIKNTKPDNTTSVVEEIVTTTANDDDMNEQKEKEAIFVGEINDDPKSDENNESDREVEEILDKRLVEGKEPWYLIKWKNVDHSNNTWEPIEHLKCGEALIEAFEEKIQNQDPDEEYEVEEVCGKKRIDGDLYYFVKWKGYPDASNTWEPEENIYAKDKIEEFEAKFKQVPKTPVIAPPLTDRSSRRRRPVKETLALDPDFDEEMLEDDDVMPIAPSPASTTSSRAKPSGGGRRRATKSPSKSRRAKVDDDELDDPNYDEFYDKLNVRVPPSTYDTSDFDKSHLFHIRMSNYLSWIILEHHIHYFDEIKPDPRQVRQEKLHKRLQFYHMKQEMVDLVLSREVGVWEAILCMNAAQRRLEIEKMRRSLRDNESIPIPLEWNIMKFVAQIDKRRRKQFGFVDPTGSTTSRGRGGRKKLGTTAKRRQPPKKRAPPKKRKKPDPDSDLDDFIAPDDQSSEEILSDPEGDEEIAKEMEAELEKDHEDDVIPVPSEGELDDDPELEALTKIAEETQERQIQQQQQVEPSNILAVAAAEAQIDSPPQKVVPIENEPQSTPPTLPVTHQSVVVVQPVEQQQFTHIMPNEQFNLEKAKDSVILAQANGADANAYYNSGQDQS